MKKNKIIILTIIVLIFVILGLIFICWYSKYKTYNKAETLLQEENYVEAKNYFNKIKNYKDSNIKILECDYLNANYLYEIQEYEKAYNIYILLDNYKDSRDLALKSNYELAKQYANEEKYSEAYIEFLKLRNYEESEQLNQKYKRLMIENSKKGDTIYYGNYEQDGDNSNGTEPIAWLVLEKNNEDILIISKDILEKMRFGTSYYWKKSEVREWLNNEFYNNALSEEERKCIQSMITSNETEDKIFCLSAEEARGLFTSNWYRIAYPTKKLLLNGFKVCAKDLPSGEWWTRSISTAKNGKGVVPVEGDGNVRSAGTNELAPAEYTYTDIGVRPVMCINISEVQEKAKNMNIFGFDSNTDLDNEPNLWGY